ncbi:isoflavone reductase family protein [Phyllosticta citribraziliensis]|uniref:Isoflavone reductase family protein n=1 Tax=Phyllosticta citribraziliensis TaxID=989973 RepID=A0ABR1LLW9_9PEZI
MSSPIKNVVLVGAGGNLGPAVLKEFLDSSLNVTVLTRSGSKSTFPPNVKTVQSEYTHDALASVFKTASTDAIVSLVGDASAQTPIIDAAITAGVKRFIPTEYGCNTSDPKVIELVPILAGKRKTAEYLETKQDSISWTSLITGPFFDWGLNVGFLGFNIADAKVRRWDGGETRWSATNLQTIGRALVNLLIKPDAYNDSANKYVFIESHSVTQNEIQAALEKATGKTFTVAEEVNGEQRVKTVYEALGKGDYSTVTDLLLAATLSKTTPYGRWESTWNERLGLKEKSLDEDVKDIVQALKG